VSSRIPPETGKWQFLIDENIDPKVATYLAKGDVFAEHVQDAHGQGADDDDLSVRENRKSKRIGPGKRSGGDSSSKPLRRYASTADRLREIRGESLALQGGDEADQ